jgi:hypothetical protein
MRDLLRLARILAAAAALAAMTACMGTEKPVVEATGVPVGGGVNVPAGSNEDFIVNVGGGPISPQTRPSSTRLPR